MVQSKFFFSKNLVIFLCITNNEIGQNLKSKPKKFSFLCTLKKILKKLQRKELLRCKIKGSLTQDFRLQVFIAWLSFYRAPENSTSGAISKFYKNSLETLRGPGENWFMKKPEVGNLVSDSLYVTYFLLLFLLLFSGTADSGLQWLSVRSAWVV